MRRLGLICGLLVALVASAVALVALKHQGRQMFIELEQQSHRFDELQFEWSRLQIELAWMGETMAIESRARESLGMHSPDNVGVLVAEHD
ncbi:MAG: cell division protein FtsL [Wenzhouxiangellaceae bacterium]